MKPLLTFFTAGSIVLLLYSCEGFRSAEGVVKDKLTNAPLDSVLCTVVTGDETIYTDSTGRFKLQNRMGGCMFGCKIITVQFSKAGYKTTDITNPEGNTTVYMER